MCYTAIPGETGCLAVRDVPQIFKSKKPAAVPKKKAAPPGKSCGRTAKRKTLSFEEERDGYRRRAKNAKAKNAKRNQHRFGHARKDAVNMKHEASL